MAALNPNFFLNSGDRIVKQWIPAGYQFLRRMPISVSTIVTPCNFWIHIEGPSTTESLVRLEEQMVQFYKHAPSWDVQFNSITEIQQNMFVAMPFQSAIHRVQVLGSETMGSRVIASVFHCDYGLITKCNVHDLMKLALPFSYFPQQAIWASMENIRPKNGAVYWPQEVCTDFTLMVMHKKLEAEIRGANLGLLKIYVNVNDISVPGNVICINDLMVQKGNAEECETFPE